MSRTRTARSAFHGKGTGSVVISGSADITLAMLLGAETENASLDLRKQ